MKYKVTKNEEVIGEFDYYDLQTFLRENKESDYKIEEVKE